MVNNPDDGSGNAPDQDRQAIYDEFFTQLIEPSADPVREKIPVYGSDVWGFCPIHETGGAHRRRSMHITLKKGMGIWCFAMCDIRDVMAALRERDPEGPPVTGIKAIRRKYRDDFTEADLVSIYDYEERGPSGEWETVAQKGRFERMEDGHMVKAFKWRLGSDENGPWSGLGNKKITDIPLYQGKLIEQYPGSAVWIAEGEKATDALNLFGCVAVCPPGGAQARDYGDIFLPLRKRQVIIWPDNDGPGKTFAANVRAALQQVETDRIALFDSPLNLPPKGDAFDYFQMGGSMEQIQEKLKNDTLVDMAIDILGDDEFRARYPTALGTFYFHVTNLSANGTRSMEGNLSAGFLTGITGKQAYRRRINLLSNSQIVESRRELEEIYRDFGAKTIGLTEILNQCVSAILERCNNQDRSVDIVDIVPGSGEKALVDPLVVDGVPVVWFGDGGASKTYLAFGLAASFVLGEPFCGMNTPGLPALYVDYEGTKGSFHYRMERIRQGLHIDRYPAHSLFYWNAQGMPMADQIEAIAKKVTEARIGLVIIDSAAPATGGAPEDAATTVAFFRGLARIPAAKVIIGHINKAGDTQKVFGSAYWHNTPRRTFYVMKAESTTSPTILEASFLCRKVNDGAVPQPIGVRVRFDDPDGAVTFERFDIKDNAELITGLGLRDQIMGALTNRGALGVDELTRQLNMPSRQSDTVLAALEKYSDGWGANALFFKQDDGRWALQGQVARKRRGDDDDDPYG